MSYLGGVADIDQLDLDTLPRPIARAAAPIAVAFARRRCAGRLIVVRPNASASRATIVPRQLTMEKLAAVTVPAVAPFNQTAVSVSIWTTK